MQNNIPAKTLLKGLELIQRAGVDEEKIFSVKKLVDPERGEKILQAYIQKGKVGNLDLRGNLNVEKLPRGLKCITLNLWGNKTLKHLPQMEAKEIWANNTNIQKIDEGLKCEYLNLNGNKSLKHLPKIEVERIRAMNTNIQTIADGFKCELLDLEGNHTVKEFPRNLNVRRLDLTDTYFSETYTEAEMRQKIKDGGGEVREINYYT